jgi:hypothetical protein
VPDADVKLAFGTDAAVTDETCRRLTNSNPDVLWMILLDVDSEGHASGWGPTVSNYVRAIETADGRVGQIIGALTSRATYTNENWLVIVQTDHGQHDDPDPERSRVVFTILSGSSVPRGVIWPSPAIVDVCAAVLAHMGVPSDPAWNLDARLVGFPTPPTRYGTNLIVNGDAEANSGTNGYTPDRGIAWWFDVASTTLGIYGSDSNFPGPASPGPANRGANFFLGGATNGSILQRIEISDLAAEVDGLGLDFTLAGWFGGKADEEDWAMLSARFLDTSGAVIGSNAVGHVTAVERGGITGLLSRSTSSTLPGGTRYVEFALTNHVVTGGNDGSADNLSFVLTTRVPPVIMAYGKTTDGWQVEFTTSLGRLYSLERSEDLKAWVEVAPPTTGSGGTAVLVDTNTPPGEAFYRIGSRHP